MRPRAHRDYTGKTSKRVGFPLDGRWHDIPEVGHLNGSLFNDPWELHTAYIRLYPEWPKFAPASVLDIEWRWRRDNGDFSGHDGRQYAPGTSSIPIRPYHDEVGEKGVGGKWQLKLEGGPDGVTLGTRYAKLFSLEVDWA